MLSERSFLSTIRVLLAILKRQFINFLRYPTWVLFIFVMPFIIVAEYVFLGKLFTGPSGLVTASFRESAGTSDYLGFMVIGGMAMTWLFSVLWGIGQSLREEQLQGTLEQNWLCPVPRFVLLLGRSLTSIVIQSLSIGLVLLGAWWFFDLQFQGSIFLTGLILILAVLSLYGLGFIFAGLILLFKEPHALTEMVASLLVIICGVVYPLSVLPAWAQKVGKFIPLTWIIRDLRAVLLKGAGFGELASDLGVLSLWAIIMPALGFSVFSLIEYRARRRGTLGQY